MDALCDSEARFRGTFENAAVGMAHVALDGAWLAVNDRLCAITGYSRDELLARTFQDITHPDLSPISTMWPRPNSDTGGEFGDGRKSRALRHFDSRMRISLRESRRFLIDNLSFHLILQSMDGHVTSIAPNRPDS